MYTCGRYVLQHVLCVVHMYACTSPTHPHIPQPVRDDNNGYQPTSKKQKQPRRTGYPHRSCPLIFAQRSNHVGQRHRREIDQHVGQPKQHEGTLKFDHVEGNEGDYEGVENHVDGFLTETVQEVGACAVEAIMALPVKHAAFCGVCGGVVWVCGMHTPSQPGAIYTISLYNKRYT